MRERGPIPETIKNAPQIALGLDLYWSAFMELNTCRPPGMDLGQIPWTAIYDYALALELDAEETENMVEIIRAMDQELMRLDAEARKGR